MEKKTEKQKYEKPVIQVFKLEQTQNLLTSSKQDYDSVPW